MSNCDLFEGVSRIILVRFTVTYRPSVFWILVYFSFFFVVDRPLTVHRSPEREAALTPQLSRLNGSGILNGSIMLCDVL